MVSVPVLALGRHPLHELSEESSRSVQDIKVSRDHINEGCSKSNVLTFA